MLTEETKMLVLLFLLHPVLRHHSPFYKIDDNFLYFPSDIFFDLSSIDKLLADGIITEVIELVDMENDLLLPLASVC